MNDPIRKIVYFLIFIGWIPQVHSQIYINEFQAYNASSYLEKWWGNFPDWIELYNGGDNPVNLSGYFITDDINIPDKWELPSETVFSGDYKLIFADKVAYKRHTNFSLNGKGEQILLYSPDLVLIDSISFGIQYPDISYGRYPDGTQNWYFFEENTPDQGNSPNHLTLAAFAAEAQFSKEGGYYTGSQTITISSESPTGIIRYTDDGSDPTGQSPIYTGPITISSTTVLRAKVYEDGLFASPTATRTYILDKEITLPVISISMDWDHLYDGETGIYVEGTNGILGNCSEIPVNYNQDWERPINIEYYDVEGNPGINQQAGTKIFGACSRRAEQKSLSIFARGKYGKERFNYKLFNDKEIDKFSSFIIRNSGNDLRHTMLRDGMMQTLVKDRMDVDYQEYQPAIVYLNGAYWGILNIREKINEDFLAANHGIDPDSVDMLYKHVEVIEGDDTHFQNMMDFIRSNDLSNPDNYRYVGTQMDINQFLNYYIAQIYYFNQDWPAGNYKYWRSQTPDGRWRWLLYDLDFGFDFLQYHDNMVEWVTTGSDESTELFRELLTNDGFYNEFLQRLCSHMNTSFLPERVIGIIDSLAANIEPEMPYHIDKWYWPGSMSNWYDELKTLTDFAETRLPELTNNLIKRFALDGTFELATSVTNPDYGRILVSGVEIPDLFSGAYIKNIPLRINAIPEDGYQFLGWEGASASLNNDIELTLSSDASISAHFGPVVPLTNLHINELSSNNENSIPDEYGEMEDWIEIYNSGSEPVQLAGLYLSDSLQHPTKYMIPFGYGDSTMVYPDSSIVLYADNQIGQGPLHLDFRLGNEGETITMIQKIRDQIIILDSVSYSSQVAGSVAGRLPDGTGDWQRLFPTPGNLNKPIPMLTGLYINEFSSSNIDFPDLHGEFDDWIEIYNHNDEAIDIGGLFITDSLAFGRKHRIPTTHPDSTTIPAKGYLVLFADNQPHQGVLHIGFGLSRQGEQIGLVQWDGNSFLDSLTYGEQYRATSLSRYPDGAGEWFPLPSTPGGKNVRMLVSGLFINEFSAHNDSIITDGFGEFDDWIEIYNDNDVAVDLGGLFITDSLAAGTRHRIPTTYPDSTTIPPKGYLLLWADNQSDQGILHLGFGLKRSGEQIGLLQHDGASYIDSVTYPEQYYNASVSRYRDGEDIWHYLPPTPARENMFNTITGLFFTEFSASNSQILADGYGEYDDWIEIYNDNDVAVNLGGLFITDSVANGAKFRIPTIARDSTTIPPKGYMILWADNQPGQGVLHLGFRLSRSGEQLGLLQYNGTDLIDSCSFGVQYINSSQSRYWDQNNRWSSVPSTPGETNYSETITGIYINEFSASNMQLLTDEYGEADDWIELYNDNEIAIDIGGLFITDSLSQVTQHRIPTTAPDSTTILPGEHMVLWADKQPGQGILHLNFGLKREGEQIGLADFDGSTFIDSLSYEDQYRNASQSRLPDGENQWYQIPSTPGEKNEYRTVSGIYINEFASSNRYIMKDNFGEYDDWIELYNDNETAIDIGGLFITDSLANITKYRIPTTSPDSTTIPSGGFKVLWADNQMEQGVLHLDFGLTREGEQIGLFEHNGIDFIDTLTYGEILVNTSLSRFPDGENTWLSMNSTPGTSNIKDEYLRLYVNEYRAGNPTWNSTAQYEDGNWIELFNNNEYDLDIGGLYVTDNLTFPNKFRISDSHPEITTIPPRGFLLLWTDHQENQGILHLNFTLQPEGTEIGLARKVLDRYVYIDTLKTTYQHVSVSTGRVKDGVNSWTNFSEPTPGWSNTYLSTSTSSSGIDDFKAYPNPVSNGILHLSHPRSVKLYDQLGNQVLERTNVIHLNLSSVPVGLYFLKTEHGEVIRVVII